MGAGSGEAECDKGPAAIADQDEGEWGGGAVEQDRGHDIWGEAADSVFESGNDAVTGGCDFYGDVSVALL